MGSMGPYRVSVNMHSTEGVCKEFQDVFERL